MTGIGTSTVGSSTGSRGPNWPLGNSGPKNNNGEALGPVGAALISHTGDLCAATVDSIDSAGSLGSPVAAGPSDIQAMTEDLVPPGGLHGLAATITGPEGYRAVIVVDDNLREGLCQLTETPQDPTDSGAWLSLLAQPLEAWARGMGATIDSALPVEGVRQLAEIFAEENLVVSAAGLFAQGLHVGTVAIAGFNRDNEISANDDALSGSGVAGKGQGSLRPPGSTTLGEADQLFSSSAAGLSRISVVWMTVRVEIGRKRMKVANLLSLAPGSLIELDRAAGSPVDLLVNNTLVAKGEVVVIDGEYGVRVTDIVGAES